MNPETKIFLRMAICVTGYCLCLVMLCLSAIRELELTAVTATVLLFLASWRQEGVIRREINMAEARKWSCEDWDEQD